MTGSESTSATEPQVVEVDKIDVAVDPNDAVLDDDGAIVQHFDREKNTIFRVKGKDNPLADKKDFDAEGKDKDKDKNKDKDKTKNDKKDDSSGKDKTKDSDKEDENEEESEEEESEEEESEYNNPAERLLRRSGYKQDEVDLGEGIGKVKLSELTVDQQVAVLANEVDDIIDDYEDQITQLEARQPELKFKDPAAQQIVDYLKEGGDIKKLAKEILSRDPAAQAKMLSDEEIVKLSIKKEFAEWTDEEIDQEFKDMEKAGSIARRAKSLRARMEKETPKFDDLTQEQKVAKQAEIEAAKEAFNKDIEGIRTAAKGIKKIAGITVSENVVNHLLKKVIPADMDSDSEFVSDLVNNPAALIESQFWRDYGPKVIKQTAEYYFNKGIEKANEGKDKLSDEPIRTYQTKAAGKKKGTEQKVSIPSKVEDIDFERLLSDFEF